MDARDKHFDELLKKWETDPADSFTAYQLRTLVDGLVRHLSFTKDKNAVNSRCPECGFEMNFCGLIHEIKGKDCQHRLYRLYALANEALEIRNKELEMENRKLFVLAREFTTLESCGDNIDTYCACLEPEKCDLHISFHWLKKRLEKEEKNE